MTELIITEIQACDTQNDFYRFVHPASDDTPKGNKIYGRRKMLWRRRGLSEEGDGADREATAFDDNSDDNGEEGEDYHHHHLQI
jgi:hypothetical protein